jgi:hypothetical protein
MIAIALAFVIILVGLLRGGRMGFSFLPQRVEGNVDRGQRDLCRRHAAPTGRRVCQLMMEQAALRDRRITSAATCSGSRTWPPGARYFSNGRQAQTGDQFASVTVELIPSDQRDVRNERVHAKTWESRLTPSRRGSSI